jgi:DNA polymerase elongation subunit (family B)
LRSSISDQEEDCVIAAGLLVRDLEGREDLHILRGPEGEILTGVARAIEGFCGVLVTYNGLEFDLPFLARRAERLGVAFPFSFDYTNRVNVASTAGVLRQDPLSFPRLVNRPKDVVVVDVLHLVARHQFTTRSLGPRLDLASVARRFGVGEPNRPVLAPDKIPQASEDVLHEYIRADLVETLRLFELLATPYLVISFITNLPLEEVVVRGAPWVWEQILERHYRCRPQADPKENYPGGLVVCRPGLYSPCMKLDIASLYPNIMMAYNVRSRKDRDAVMLSWLSSLLEERLKLKERAKAGDQQAKIADTALKLMLNSAYGFTGSGYPFNDMKAAARVTEIGRKILVTMIAAAEDAGGVVVEADTDGLIVRTDDRERVLKAVTSALPKPFQVGLDWSECTVFVSDRKNYTVLGPDGKVIEVRGAKWRGSDREALWSTFPVEFLRRLAVDGLEAALEYARRIKEEIATGCGWEWVVRTHRVSKADRTLQEAGFREGELATYAYRLVGSSRKEVSRSSVEGYDRDHYVKELSRVLEEMASVCGFEVPQDLRYDRKRRRQEDVIEPEGVAPSR